MNKTQLINHIANQAELTKADAGRAVDAFTDAVSETLKNGGSVQLTGFGSFGVNQRSARSGRNPQTGETIQIAARKVPNFKAGKVLKDAVN
ncbi:DNA-binding protein HU-1 [Saliniradius amylolyticus]|uniref:DNA-binding protein HU-1 n=1 Tax=Saliniradius amylolyticus TaxID=2183582 RepID=A0A2S2E5A8_9ALTE|nr:HU family DNA-binding protein [Saliniradius amylolyticus]AWL12779.1 DNA-binding protein HU-1 [Saliniradius amylolyticus]